MYHGKPYERKAMFLKGRVHLKANTIYKKNGRSLAKIGPIFNLIQPLENGGLVLPP